MPRSWGFTQLPSQKYINTNRSSRLIMAYINKIYSLYGKNRMDIFEGRCNEQSKLIKASQEFFLQQEVD